MMRKKTKAVKYILIAVSFSLLSNFTNAQHVQSSLNAKQKSIISVASLTAKGDLVNLKPALETGLEAGLTVNEIKEVLVHLYAYCGFPRSIRGLQTFMEVLDERKARGIIDEPGREASPIEEDGNKYERGKKIIEELTQTPQPDTLTGYSAFAPVIDTFLKKHLFADIFERDVLTYPERQLVTISVLSTIGSVEPMLRSHLAISRNVGLSFEQLDEFILIIRPIIGRKKTNAAKGVWKEVRNS